MAHFKEQDGGQDFFGLLFLIWPPFFLKGTVCILGGLQKQKKKTFNFFTILKKVINGFLPNMAYFKEEDCGWMFFGLYFQIWA